MARKHALALDSDEVDRRVAEGAAERLEFEGLDYVRFRGGGGIEPGVVAVGGRLVPAYARIGRIFALRAGVERAFRGPFLAEEKIDGFNVRVVRAEGRILAITRSGHVCPFATDRVPELAPVEEFFGAHPELVLCGELAGPENPYLRSRVPGVEEDVRFFGFDLMRTGERGFVRLGERDALFERFGVPSVPRLGFFEPQHLDRLRAGVLELDRRGSEGVVLKAPEGNRRLKYVTPSANLQDIVEDASLLAELPGEFLSSRLVRLVIGLDELGLHERASRVAAELGQALVSEFDETLHRFRSEGALVRTFEVRLREERRIGALVRHINRISRRVRVSEVERRFDGHHHRVTLRKVFQVTTSWLHAIYRGRSVYD